MLAPPVALVLLIVFLVTVAIGKMVSLGSLIIAALFPVVCWVVYPDNVALLLFALLAASLVIWRHRANIMRISRGVEPKITFKRRLWDEMKSRSSKGSE